MLYRSLSVALREFIRGPLRAMLVASSLCASAAHAQVVMTFSGLAQPGNGYYFHSNPYVEAGFMITPSRGFCTAETPTTTSDFYAGSTGMSNCYQNGVNTLTQVGGGTFSLNSIDLAPFAASYGGGAAVTFYGFTASSTLTSTVYAPSTLVFQTYAFSGWDNLTAVSWAHVSPYHQFDNVTVDPHLAVAAPEPTSVALVATGLVGIAALTRRRKQVL